MTEDDDNLKRQKREVQRMRKKEEETERRAREGLKAWLGAQRLFRFGEAEKERMALAILNQMRQEWEKKAVLDDAKSHEMRVRRH